MTEDEAIMQMELLGHDFFVFTHAETSAVNVLYRRRRRQLRPDPVRASTPAHRADRREPPAGGFLRHWRSTRVASIAAGPSANGCLRARVTERTASQAVKH